MLQPQVHQAALRSPMLIALCLSMLAADPLFKAVLKVRPRLDNTTQPSSSAVDTTQAPPAASTAPAPKPDDDDALGEDEKERRRMERQELKRRKKLVLNARAEDEAGRARAQDEESAKRASLERAGEWDPKAIWTEEEVPRNDITEDDYKDDRTEPEYANH